MAYSYPDSRGSVAPKTCEDGTAISDIVVLGAAVYRPGEPSRILRQRLDTAIALWKKRPDARLIMSGDATWDHANEPKVMRDYAISKGVPRKKVFQDPEGYSTSETLRNVARDFNSRCLVIVTNQFHVPRAVWLGRSYHLETYGVYPKPELPLPGAKKRQVREFMARAKDFWLGWGYWFQSFVTYG
ncbi:hypothetical protein BK816_03820 [Boudabousia tangfeifanii]|uniref:DUF218 domain-containing protein n=1 Tax=Boudabousia tangfeifanii TaxID=1912795 RepID=A0A1D9MK31_9ACTO|nr:YdcF family protein [Boudabousia tangfeifanii]AOZ72530.1 hypothetical protein BK816_03820 [Boudabousia tangfeifanii]